jgi:hypothetical protein
MSDVSPLSEVKQKLDFGDVRAVDDPKPTWASAPVKSDIL